MSKTGTEEELSSESFHAAEKISLLRAGKGSWREKTVDLRVSERRKRH